MKETNPVIESPRYIENATLDGVGSIVPTERQRRHLPELLARLDQAYVPVASPYLVPYLCMDGRRIRRSASDTRPDGPTAAGGTLTITVGRDLCGDGYIAPDLAALHYELASDLSDNGYPVGGHCRDLASLQSGDRNIIDMTTDCIGIDHLPDIYRALRDQARQLAQFASVCGFDIAEPTIQLAETTATKHLAHPTWVPRPNENGLRLIMDELHSVDASGVVELEPEPHAECAIVLNTRPHTTIDRDHLHEMFADPAYPTFRMDVFSIDVWALGQAALAFQPDDEPRRQQLYQAMLLFNIATAYIACGHGMPVVVR